MTPSCHQGSTASFRGCWTPRPSRAACHRATRATPRCLKGLVRLRGACSTFRLAGVTCWGAFRLSGALAGIIISALVHPLSYALILHDAASGLIFQPAESTFGHQLWVIAVFNLVAGYAASLALGFFALRGRRVRRLVPQLVFIPIYWLLISAAAIALFYPLVKAPLMGEDAHASPVQTTPNRSIA